jgi:hypothetical protein
VTVFNTTVGEETNTGGDFGDLVFGVCGGKLMGPGVVLENPIGLVGIVIPVVVVDVREIFPGLVKGLGTPLEIIGGIFNDKEGVLIDETSVNFFDGSSCNPIYLHIRICLKFNVFI